MFRYQSQENSPFKSQPKDIASIYKTTLTQNNSSAYDIDDDLGLLTVSDTDDDINSKQPNESTTAINIPGNGPNFLNNDIINGTRTTGKIPNEDQFDVYTFLDKTKAQATGNETGSDTKSKNNDIMNGMEAHANFNLNGTKSTVSSSMKEAGLNNGNVSECVTKSHFNKRKQTGVVERAGKQAGKQDTANGDDSRRNDYCIVKNMIDSSQFTDTLHKQATEPVECRPNSCFGSVMFPPPRRPAGSLRKKEDILDEAVDFINQYYQSIKQKNTEDHTTRLDTVRESIERGSSYELTADELIFGSKTAWRNAARCIGRIQWFKLKVFNCLHVTTAQEMFEAICQHLEYGTNKGIIRSAITVFPPRTDLGHDYRIWNGQLISYAGYLKQDGSVIGDPAGVEFTQVCENLGWRGKGGRFDVLPLVLSANGGDPELFVLPAELALEVKITHPKYEWFAELGLQWFAVPAVSGMMFDCGGLEFTATCFNGWYMSTEIGSRDLCDPQRYNILQTVAEKLKLDTKNPSSLWKDRTLVEINVAVIYSYQKANVTITDHHAASESFLQHMENEQRLRGGCPADWVWVVPPMSSSILPVFHQEMFNYKLKPSYEYQQAAWKTLNRKKNTKAHHFKRLGRVVIMSTALMMKALRKRIKCTVLYATETGRSEKFSKRLSSIFNRAFNVQIVCMANYNLDSLKEEHLVLVVTSTFGEGEPPENGESFAEALSTLRDAIAAPTEGDMLSDGWNSEAELTNNTHSYSHVRYSVFALGSSAYPNFCHFGHFVDDQLLSLGATRIHETTDGDELSGQEESFTAWSRDTFKDACKVFDIDKSVYQSISHDPAYEPWTPNMFRFKKAKSSKEPPLFYGLSRLHHKNVTPCRLITRTNLQAETSSRQTILVEIESSLPYQPGDHLGIYPANSGDLVLKVLSKLKDAPHPHDLVCVEENSEPHGGGRWSPLQKLPPFTLMTAFTHYLDITHPPSQEMLKMLATQATNPADAKKLEILGSKLKLYRVWKEELYPNLADVFRLFPSLSVSPTLLITQLPLQQLRFYSISSTPQAFPGEIHATVGIVDWNTEGQKIPRIGVCSTFLNTCAIGTTVPCIVHKSPNFHLPKDHTLPIIMVGPGTGIAPLRSFWLQRGVDMETALFQKDAEKAKGNWGEMSLYFGCREEGVDQIYKDEIIDAQENGIISNYYTAFSRDKTHPKKHVQDILVENSVEVLRAIQRGGHIYVCGSAPMASGLKSTLEKILQKSASLSAEVSHLFVRKLQDSGRLHEDIFGGAL